MPGVRTSKVVLKRRGGLDVVKLALADGLEEVARTIIEVADPPDATPFGEGLVTSGGTYISVDGKKVGGDSAKPRGANTARGIVALAGWGFPGRFQEFGTVHHAAQPFATPALDRVAPSIGQIMAPVVRGRLG